MNANYKSIISAISLFLALSTSISAAPGDLDLSFGNGGKVITPFSSDIGESEVAIQADGKIVVVGDGYNGTTKRYDFAVSRYNTDGSLDSSFGGTGIVLTPVGNFPNDHATSVAIQADGKIVVVGYSFNGGANGIDFAAVRYNTDGSLDTSFNGTGKVVTPIGSSHDVARSVAIQADGKIVAAGGSYNGANYDFAVVRYNTDGTLDTSFGGTGKVITPIGSSYHSASSVAIQSDGKIVAAGSSQGVSNDFRTNDFAVVRYNADGSLDTSFNGTGKVVTPIGNSYYGASSVAIQSDGKIVAAGGSYNGASYDFAVVRYNPNGSLDTSFNGTGKVVTPIGSADDFAASVAIQADGKIVVAGSSGNGSGDDFAVVRLNPNGSLDTSFNGTGKVITPVGKSSAASSVAVQADGKIVVAGATTESDGIVFNFAVVRYQGDGAPAACPNPIDCAEFFVRQHYRDFFNREPDPPGLAFWTNQITSCGADAQCVEAKRVNVSAAFFLSIEFQETGYLVHRLYKVAYNNLPGKPVPLRREEFVPDSQAIAQGVVVGVGNWEQQLEANKTAFVNEFTNRPRFTAAFPSGMSAAEFVDALNANAGGALSQAERDALVGELASGAKTRAQVLRAVAEDADFAGGPEKNRAFVLAQYFGYLRRNPDDIGFDGQPDPNFVGYNFWLNKLNQFNGNYIEAEMVKAFIVSIEYRRRFGQP
ncbi:MAG: hypothetical protein ACR2H4_08090 [Pyrinomonadaceae bacterium]